MDEKAYYPSTLGAAGRSYASEAQAMPPKQQPINSLYEAMNYLREASGMARNTADQLCGSQPESIGKDASAKSGSYFGQIEDVAEEIRALSARITGDMQRVLGRL